MELREHLRKDFHKYIRNKIINNKCEFCGSKENLHLHHMDKFHNQLIETLEELQVAEMDTENYDENVLKTITYFMRAKQMEGDYKTLCACCHKKLHGREKYTDEYKAHYYNPFGGYNMVNVKDLNKLEITDGMLFRYLYLASYMNYDNYIVWGNSKSENRYARKKDIQEILGLENKQFYNTINEFIDKKMISIIGDRVYVNNKLIFKGTNNKPTCEYVIVFNEGIKDIYKRCSSKRHKTVGFFVKNIINSKKSIVKKTDLAGKGGKFLKNSLPVFENGETLTANYDSHYVMINPRFIYKGYTDIKLKNVCEEFVNISNSN